MKNNSLYRIFVIVTMFIKFLAQLYFFNKRHTHWDAATREKWEELLKKQAAEYRDKAIKLEGLMIKAGQFLSSRADLFPEVFLKELEDLIDRVPPVPARISRQILEKEWGRDIGDWLVEISDQPVASASIGEVYKGRLHNGEEVAIKIQRHNIEKIFRTDFKALRIVLWIAKRFTKFGKQADLKSLHKELVRVMSDELNFSKELKNGVYFKKRFHDSNELYIPHYFEDFSTRRVLVMEWIDAEKMNNTSFLIKHNINQKQLAEKVFKFFMDQLLEDGMFHADPHPGNILVKSDGTLVVLDFGMVGVIKKQDALMLRKVVQGLVLEDYALVVKQLGELGFLLPHANKHKLQAILRQSVETYLENGVGTVDQELIGEIFEDIQELVQEQPIQLPTEFAFLGRAASIALGLLTIVDPEIDFIKLGKPVVQDWINDTEEEEGSLQFQVLKDSAKPLLAVPRNLNEWLQGPKYARRAETRREWRGYDHHRYLLFIGISSLTFLISLIFLFLSIIMDVQNLFGVTAALSATGLGSTIMFLYLHKRWVSGFRENND
ncbi:AarF/ABC1/UbiB kinase family protein [Bacillus sp. H-16]|uniref:ABC1 kinase family protein n=1 Tax=Alteribacter salitolerans TaxID=2912333 RepID=UPI001964D04D|nr:AarF/UbiB family protein [Alteribacter salitolerans]MBM7097411.1 AarF/ABC1/UbiB kinase family protein [Alteribacter salitolerans]